MKVSREQVAENRKRILEAAGRLFRERGFDGVTVAEIMAAAGLTHGAFYGHFASKDDLIAAAMQELLVPDPTAPVQPRDIAAYAAGYLSGAHRENLAGGCVFAGLGSEAVRSTDTVRHTMTDSLRRQIEALSLTAPGETQGERRRAAIGAWAAMVGAVTLARIADDPALSDEVLAQTKAWLGV